MLILTDLGGWFFLLICLLKNYHREKTHSKSATNKGNMKIFAISLVPGGIFVMDRSGQGKWEEKKILKNRSPKGIKCFLIEIGSIPSLTFKKGFDLQ